MSTLTTSTGSTAPNSQALQAQINRPDQSNKKKKSKKRASYTSILRSAVPLPNDPDTARIQARLASGGTATEIAEEAYRMCRFNASLRRDLAAAKAALAAPLDTDADTARIKNRLDNNATAKEIAVEAYRVCRVNAHVKSGRNRAQAELRETRKKIAVKDDALNEMRKEYPEMRRILQRTWGLLRSRGIIIPEGLSKRYEAVMQPDMHEWQGKKEFKKTAAELSNKEQAKAKGMNKVEVKELEKKELGKTTFLLHMENGRKYDLGKPLAEQDSDGEESEPEVPVVSKNKRKGGEIDEPVAKKAKTDDLEECETAE